MNFAGEAIQKYVRRMTNWQRNQWAKAGRPTDQESLLHFTHLTKYGDAPACGGKQECERRRRRAS